MALSAGCRGRWTRTRRSVPPHNHLVVIACAAVTTSWESTVGATSQVDIAKGPDWVHVGPGDPRCPVRRPCVLFRYSWRSAACPSCRRGRQETAPPYSCVSLCRGRGRQPLCARCKCRGAPPSCLTKARHAHPGCACRKSRPDRGDMARVPADERRRARGLTTHSVSSRRPAAEPTARPPPARLPHTRDPPRFPFPPCPPARVDPHGTRPAKKPDTPTFLGVAVTVAWPPPPPRPRMYGGGVPPPSSTRVGPPHCPRHHSSISQRFLISITMATLTGLIRTTLPRSVSDASATPHNHRGLCWGDDAPVRAIIACHQCLTYFRASAVHSRRHRRHSI